VNSRRRLRDLLADGGTSIVPGVTNALWARLAEEAGFEAVFTTGSGIANSLLGVPDLGLTTMTEIVEVAGNVVSATALPVIADADTGYGNHLNVRRTVQAFERIGVAGLVLEDQVAPKRCGHFRGKQVIPAEDMVQKILAALSARTDPDLVLVARTDALAVEGLGAALRRAAIYASAGADMIFVESPRTREEIAAIPMAVPVPCLINLVEGGDTPLLTRDELAAMGYRFVLYANLALRVASRAVEEAFAVLQRDGSSQMSGDALMPWPRRQQLVGLAAWEAFDQRIQAEAAAVVAGVAAPSDNTADAAPGDPPGQARR
jgi:2-methylisocitrate lyase-like PEP mutase family enzyme